MRDAVAGQHDQSRAVGHATSPRPAGAAVAAHAGTARSGGSGDPEPGEGRVTRRAARVQALLLMAAGAQSQGDAARALGVHARTGTEVALQRFLRHRGSRLEACGCPTFGTCRFLSLGLPMRPASKPRRADPPKDDQASPSRIGRLRCLVRMCVARDIAASDRNGGTHPARRRPATASTEDVSDVARRRVFDTSATTCCTSTTTRRQGSTSSAWTRRRGWQALERR